MGLTVCIHVIVSPLSRNICVVSIPLRSSPLAHKHAVLTTSGSHSFLSLSLQKHPLKDLSMFALFKSSLPFPLESIPIRLFGPCSPHHWNCSFQVTKDPHIVNSTFNSQALFSSTFWQNWWVSINTFLYNIFFTWTLGYHSLLAFLLAPWTLLLGWSAWSSLISQTSKH